MKLVIIAVVGLFVLWCGGVFLVAWLYDKRWFPGLNRIIDGLDEAADKREVRRSMDR